MRKKIKTFIIILFLLFSFSLKAADKKKIIKTKINNAKTLHYDLKVIVKPKLKYLAGSLEMRFHQVKEAVFFLDKRAMISRVTTNSKDTRIKIIRDINTIKKLKINSEINVEDILNNVKVYLIYLDDEEDNFSKLTIDYRIIYSNTNNNIDFSHLSVQGNNSGIISKKGIYLVAGNYWYPFFPGPLGTYKLQINIAKPYSVVSEGEMSVDDRGLSRNFTFNVFYPLEFLDLVGGDYIVEEETYKGKKIGTYFFLPDSKYSSMYIKKTKDFIDLYEKLFTPYPFTKFLIVENFLQTGYGMPSFTLLGNRVIPLPFIVTTSLGHEILHNWWGNSVYVDYSQGNWCEGLTVFYADYFYSNQRGKGIDYRFQVLKDYYSYVNSDNEIAIKDFSSRTNAANRTIGYGKSMMFFYMLRNLIGKENFEKGLKDFAVKYRFKKASFSDIKMIMEKYYKKDLNWFFEQWINRKGAVKLKVELINKRKRIREYIVTLRVYQLQEGLPYILDIPAKIISENGESIKYNIRIDKKEQEIKLAFNQNPIEIQLDPDYEIFRKLYKSEVPPSISLFIGEKPVSIETSGSRFAERIKNNFPNKRIQPDGINKVIINPSIEVMKEKLSSAGLHVKRSKVELNGYYYDIRELNIVLTNKEGNQFYLLIYSTNFDFPEKTLYKITHYGKYGILIWDKNLTLIKKVLLKSLTAPLKIDLRN
jgi:hypothetical protein